MSENNNLYALYSANFPDEKTRPLLTTADGDVFTYRDAEQESARLANSLKALGAQPGDRVTVQAGKSPRCLCLYLACLRAGLVYHPLNTAYLAGELAFFLHNAEPAIVVCGSASQAMIEDITPDTVLAVLTLENDGSGTLADHSARQTDVHEVVARKESDLAALLYSSGTTGRPKGIMLTHGNLSSNNQTLVDAWGFTEEDCLLHALPIFHVHGLFVGLGCVLMSGASMVWLEKFDIDDVLTALPRCSVMMGVPTYYTRLLSEKRFSRESCSTIRLFVSGSAPLLAETFGDFESRTGHAILERYGMTETSMNISNPLEGLRRAGTVGLPLPHVEARVVGEDGATLTTGETGALQVRGPNVFPGYWRLPEKTAEDFTDDGFFDTGDQAVIESDGYVSIVGRAKDMIISGGLNIYPQEIEMLLNDMPGVVESAVVGLPHPDFGESVVAVIVGTESVPESSQLIAHCKAKLANFKVPKEVHFIDSLPRNAMGKVQKNLLRERYIAD
ncbi:MAG: malonyl-CoA/methylmalonyl-CoA synthetase [Alcanivorax sp.]|jgi:malonyl-CoA/methylmalonyl-CoA synthetase